MVSGLAVTNSASEGYMIYLKMLTIVLPTIVALVELIRDFTDRPARKKTGLARFWYTILAAVVVASSIAAGVIMVADDRDATVFREKQAEWQQDATAQLSRIGTLQNDEESRKRLFEIIRATTAKLNAKTPVEEFLASRDVRKAAREQEAEENQKALAKQIVRLQPLYGYVVSRFDSWVDGLQKKGIKITVRTNEAAAAHVSGEPRLSGPPRQIVFESGSELKLELVPGTIKEGRLAGRFAMQLHGTTPRLLSDPVWQVSVEDSFYSLVQVSGPVKYPISRGTLADPITDQEFMSGLQKSFDEAFAWVADDATITGKQ
jgi:hypothetical protein